MATDSDGPGIALLNDMALRLGRARCKWTKYPRGCKDLADVLKTFGQRGVVETINRALWMEIDGLYRMSELPPLPETPPHDSGFPGLAAHYRLRPGDLTVVTGIPGHGKTTVVNDIACRMVKRHQMAGSVRLVRADSAARPQAMAPDLVHRPFRCRAHPGGIERGRSLDRAEFLIRRTGRR